MVAECNLQAEKHCLAHARQGEMLVLCQTRWLFRFTLVAALVKWHPCLRLAVYAVERFATAQDDVARRGKRDRP